MIQATSGTFIIDQLSPDAPSPPLKKEEPVTVEGNMPKPTRQDLAKPTPRQDLAKPPTPSRQVTPALEQVDAVASEAVWVKRAAHECEREFRRRAEIAPTAGAMVHLTTVDGARTTGTLAYDPDGNVVVKIATETLELGAVLDAYDSISEVDRRLPILRPPRRVAPATPPPRKNRSGTFARVIDDAAAKLFAPAVLTPDSAAAARRRERIVGPLVPPGIEGADTMFTTARAAARAPGATTYAGLAEADRAEALAAAVSASPGRSTTAAVATVICREALHDATTAPGAALRAVAAPGADAVISTHAASAALLSTLLRYHPPLADDRDSIVAALECADAALLGADDEEDDEPSQESRYAAVLARLAATNPPAAVPERAPTTGAAATALRVVTRRRTAREKLRALVAALNVLSEELGGAPAAEELLAALSDTLAAAQIATPHAEAAFVHAFCRDRSLLLGVEGYALTSLEVALATPPPRPGDVVPQVPAPPPAAAVAA